jgi:hypothetical protein
MPSYSTETRFTSVTLQDSGDGQDTTDLNVPIAGHADIKTTMPFYSKLTEEQRRKVAQAIDLSLDAALACDRWYV